MLKKLRISENAELVLVSYIVHFGTLWNIYISVKITTIALYQYWQTKNKQKKIRAQEELFLYIFSESLIVSSRVSYD